MKKCIFLDRDGTIIVEKNYLSDPRDVELLPGAADGLLKLATLGFLLVVVTNQSGVGRGYFGVDQVEDVHVRLDELLDAHGVRINKYYFCPHLPEDECTCRKPSSGMIDSAVRELDIDIKGSYMIGDKLCDLQMGNRAGIEPILVRTGYGANLLDDQVITAAGCRQIAENLLDAANIIAGHH